MDWTKLKKEYIRGGISLKKLAEKHGVSYGTLRKVAAKEEWTELRNKARAKAGTEMAKNLGRAQGRAQTRIFAAAELLLSKLEACANSMEDIDPASLRRLVGALKDLKEVVGAKSDMDLREQKARIEKLEQEVEAARSGDEAPEITVELLGAEEYAD